MHKIRINCSKGELLDFLDDDIYGASSITAFSPSWRDLPQIQEIAEGEILLTPRACVLMTGIYQSPEKNATGWASKKVVV